MFPSVRVLAPTPTILLLVPVCVPSLIRLITCTCSLECVILSVWWMNRPFCVPSCSQSLVCFTSVSSSCLLPFGPALSVLQKKIPNPTGHPSTWS